jgi:hypothetical protein
MKAAPNLLPQNSLLSEFTLSGCYLIATERSA